MASSCTLKSNRKRDQLIPDLENIKNNTINSIPYSSWRIDRLEQLPPITLGINFAHYLQKKISRLWLYFNWPVFFGTG